MTGIKLKNIVQISVYAVLVIGAIVLLLRLTDSGEADTNKFGYAALKELPKDYSQYTAKAGGVYVWNGKTSENFRKATDFINGCHNGKDSFLRIWSLSENGDPVVTDIYYEDKLFSTTTDMTRDRFSGVSYIDHTYDKMLMRQSGELYIFYFENSENQSQAEIIFLTKDQFNYIK